MGRLRGAIGNESEDFRTDEHFDGVLRMLRAAETSDESQLALFGKQPPSPRA